MINIEYKSGDWFICLSEHCDSEFNEGDIVQINKQLEHSYEHQWACSIIRFSNKYNQTEPWWSTIVLDEKVFGGYHWNRMTDSEKLVLKLEHNI